MVKTAGVLALQGAFQAHEKHIRALGWHYQAVRQKKDFYKIDAFIIPGGESSTMLRLLKVFDLEEDFNKTVKTIPTWGICAGSILLSRKVLEMDQKSFHAIDIDIKRNAYGRQTDSFNYKINDYEVAFIRAPIIANTEAKTVEIIAKVENNPVWVTQGKVMATTFHPELNPATPSPMHDYFFSKIAQSSRS